MIGKWSVDRIIGEIAKLQAEEFLGVCKILGVSLMNEENPRQFEEMWGDVVEEVKKLNRTQRKNLVRLLRAANEGR